MRISDWLSISERQLLSSLTNLDLTDEILSIKVSIALNMWLTNDEFSKYTMMVVGKGAAKSLSKLVDGNPVVAKLFISSKERACGYDKGHLLLNYLFDNNEPSEDALQRLLLPELVKDIRSKTGLSQRNFAEHYGISKKSLEAWETGKKKISKYSFEYLKSCIFKNSIYMSQDALLKLPFSILEDGTQQYLISCSSLNYETRLTGVIWVRKAVVENPSDTIFVIPVKNNEVIRGGELVYIWQEYPPDLQECIKCAIKYGCKSILFFTKALGDISTEDGTVAEKIAKLLSIQRLPLNLNHNDFI
ncbi:helix-turn-helix domain-containing protein [Butyrivibrio hungatei]|uniref:HTH domain-containing protein n=1 Tax=Butyrivibrio hungatei TaxID=185008 RepID=A0A1D9P622_9FIRM|nr:hypothetical protein [Butyrivibrio hungatei]AOZ97942.1 HTH domain-containing protein [Butyrivibrio hungatei]